MYWKFYAFWNDDVDTKRARLEIERMRLESTQILEDPYDHT